MELGNLSLRLVGISRQTGDPKNKPGMLAEVSRLFDGARRTIKIVSGGFPSRLYCSRSLLAALDRAREERGCTVEAIVGAEADQECVEAWTSRGIGVYKLDHWPKQHFAVVDATHARLEDLHSWDEEKRVQYVVHHYKNAAKLERKFEELKGQASSVESAA